MKHLHTVTIDLQSSHIETLAKVAKRLGFADLQAISSSTAETYQMVYALAELRRSLSEQEVTER